MNNGFTRRQFLAASMTACLTALVGCGSSSRAESDGSTPASSASSAASPSPSSSAVSSSSAASVEAADPQAEDGSKALPNLETLAKGATVRSQDALSIHGDDVDASEGTVRAWVKELGYSK